MTDRVNKGKGKEAPGDAASDASLRISTPKSTWTSGEDQIVINDYETARDSTPMEALRALIPNHSAAEIRVHYQNLLDRPLTKGQLQTLGQLWIRLVILLQTTFFRQKGLTRDILRCYSNKGTMFSSYAAGRSVTPVEFERVAFHEISGKRDNIFDLTIENYDTIPSCYRVCVNSDLYHSSSTY